VVVPWSVMQNIGCLTSLFSTRPAPGGAASLFKQPAAKCSANHATDFMSALVDAAVGCDDSGSIVAFNPAAEKMFGWSAADVLGRSVSVIVAGAHKHRHDEYVCSFSETGAGTKVGTTREVEAERSDGSRFMVSMSLSQMSPPAPAFVAVMRDLSDHRREVQEGHAKLTSAISKLTSLMDLMTDGVVEINGEGIITRFSSTASAMFGYSSAEAVGKNVNLLVPKPDKAQHDSYIARYHKTGIARMIGIGREVKGERKDGSTFAMDLNITEVREGDRVSFLAVCRDVWERKEAEKKIEAYQWRLQQNRAVEDEMDAELYAAAVSVRGAARPADFRSAHVAMVSSLTQSQRQRSDMK